MREENSQNHEQINANFEDVHDEDVDYLFQEELNQAASYRAWTQILTRCSYSIRDLVIKEFTKYNSQAQYFES